MKKDVKPISKKWILISVAIAVVLYSTMGFLIWPLMAYLSSDAVYTDTVLPDMLNFLADVLEVAAVSVFYATMITLLYKYNRGMVALSVAFGTVTAYKYFINAAMTWYNTGSISLMWYWDIIDVIFYTLLEVIQLLIVYFFVNSFINDFNIVREARIKFAKDNGGEVQQIEEPYPYKKLFSVKNCLLRSAFVVAIITFVAKVSGMVVGDFGVIVMEGMPTLPETWILMTLNYASMILHGVLIYFLVVGESALMLKEKKSK